MIGKSQSRCTASRARDLRGCPNFSKTPLRTQGAHTQYGMQLLSTTELLSLCSTPSTSAHVPLHCLAPICGHMVHQVLGNHVSWCVFQTLEHLVTTPLVRFATRCEHETHYQRATREKPSHARCARHETKVAPERLATTRHRSVAGDLFTLVSWFSLAHNSCTTVRRRLARRTCTVPHH